MASPTNFEDLRREELLELLRDRAAKDAAGLRLTYEGQAQPWQIVRNVKPRRQKIEKKLSVGSEDQQSRNLIIEGENLQAMVSLYKYRGQVDLVLTDPPYNTGQDFRYNDKWEEDPNDPDLGAIVPPDDGSRHSKWLRFMVPRLWMLKEMLKPSGVLAICIDHRELFRLGLVLDQLFGEANRLGIINWQKTTVKNDKKHVASTTEYVLVYARREERAATSLLDRSEKADARFRNIDHDDLKEWKQGDLSAAGDETHPTMVYAIQNPFDGSLHYPPDGRHWANEKRRMKGWLEEWGVKYEEQDLGDKRAKALLVKGAPVTTKPDTNHPALVKARRAAETRLKALKWPRLYFGVTGQTKPMFKVYKSEVKAGSVPTTFWVDEDDEPLEIDAVSWSSGESGRSREGVEELDRIVGPGHGFQTVKPLRLFQKIIQLWCPPSGIVLDPFAGSGTTAHAVLELNRSTPAQRRFLLIEQGRPEKGDSYARSLTARRVERVISGSWASGTRGGIEAGFRFTSLSKTVDADGVLALEREEMIDLLLTSHWDQSERSSSHLSRHAAGSYAHLFASSSRREGYFLVWSAGAPSVLNRATFRAIAEEAKRAGLTTPYHIYARTCVYAGPNVEFYQIPNRILEKLGFNEASQPFRGADDRHVSSGE